MYKRIFGRLVAAGFLKNLTLSVTGMVDCAVVGHYLGANGLSAMKLAMPIFAVLMLFSMILSTGLSVSVSRDLTKGDAMRAETTVQTVLTAAVLIAAAAALAGMFCPSAVTALLAGKDLDSAVFAAATAYISPILIAALPILLFDILGTLAMLEGAARHMQWASAALLVTDVVGNLAAVWLNAGMLGIAAASGAAYLCACAVIGSFFLGKRSMFRIRLRRPDGALLRQVTVFGLPMLVYALSELLWPLSVNRLMLSYGTISGLAALSIQDAVHYLPQSLCLGVGNAALILSGIFAGEQDGDGLRSLNASILRWSLIGGTAFALALGLASEPLLRLFTDDAQVLPLSVSALRLYLTGVPFLALNYAAASYLQGLGRNSDAGKLLFVSHILVSIACAFVLAVLYGTEGIFASYGLCELITTLLIAANLGLAVRRGKTHLFRPPAGEKTELRKTIRTVEEAVDASAEVNRFCRERGIDPREAYHVALCTEELAVNSIEHGFSDGRKHHLELRLVLGENSLLLRLRDDCRRFDLVERYKMMNPEDPTRNVGLRIVFANADEVSYSSALSLNNVCVKYAVKGP